MDCSISTTVQASADKIWALLTDAAAFPRWNSTVTSIEGEIAEGHTLKLVVPSAPKRVFKPKVSHVQAGRSMIWSDGMAPMFKGVRTFTLTPNGVEQCTPANCLHAPRGKPSGGCGKAPGAPLVWSIVEQTPSSMVLTSMEPFSLTTCTSTGKSNPLTVWWQKQ